MRIKTNLRGKDYLFETKPGLFSKNEVDPGTKLLIENISINREDTVLDLGCGWGAIGIVSADLVGNGRVYMVDVDIRAIKYSLINARLNQVSSRVEIKLSDGFEELGDLSFNLIASNPPSHLAKEEIIDLVKEAKKHLKSGGKLYFVTERRIKPFIKKEFEEIFGNYQEIKEDQVYTVSLTVKTS